MLELTTSDHATSRMARCRLLMLIAAGILVLLGPFALTAPARAGYYDGYGYRPCSYGCGGYGYRRCSPCGCWRRCYSGSRPGLVYERRYVEREYVERRYAWPPHHYYRHYGYYPYGTYRSWSRPFPWGYGGVRGWRAPYGYRYEPSAERYYPSAERYYDEEPPRPPAPVWDRPDY